MKKIVTVLVFMLLSYINVLAQLDGGSKYQPFVLDGVTHRVAATPWSIVDLRGNHRAIVQVENIPSNSVKAVIARLPWRRPDEKRMDTIKIIVVNAQTDVEVKNVHVIKIDAEEGVVAFEAKQTGKYYIYYLPYKYRTQNGSVYSDYVKNIYDEAQTWATQLAAIPTVSDTAKVLFFEGRYTFDFFTLMGIIATKAEVNNIRNTCVINGYLAIAEDRAFPISLVNNLPARWSKIQKSDLNTFNGEACMNEYYTWQIGLWAADFDIKNVKITFSDFTNGSKTIPAKNFTCFNLEGINGNGKYETYIVNVLKKKVQALWCGVQIPENANIGQYKGTVKISGDNVQEKTIAININVKNEFLADKGFGDLWRHSRLCWLNSTLGIDSLPTKSYESINVAGNTISATGKRLTISPNGLPENIEVNDKKIFASPVSFIVEQGGDQAFQASNLKVEKVTDGLASWTSSSTQNGINYTCSARMEYDGYIRYDIKLSSNGNITVKNIKLVTEYTPQASDYFMGIGFDGSTTPAQYSWKWNWDLYNNPEPYDSYWIGSDKAGLHTEFRGGTYHGPLLNDFVNDIYSSPQLPPQTWANNGKGGFIVDNKKITAYSGEITISKTPIDFEFAMLITPVKPVNTKKHFSERYFQSLPEQTATAVAEGANIIGMDHGTSVNPYINYPFVVRDSLINFIKQQHAANAKVKLYYTIRELSNHAEEFYAFKSLNHEIFRIGYYEGSPWLCEHVDSDDYRPRWYKALDWGNQKQQDVSLDVASSSRWNNYYIEGLRWMFEHYDMDGIYIDDAVFDRDIMKRIRKVMDKYHQGAIVDIHANRDFSKGPANQYTEYFPYVDRIWFGENFQYDKMTPDEWFVTSSGIPFGLMGDMLQDGGNRFLGMVYGATTRLYWFPSNDKSPVPMWNFWKEFDIEDAKMIGYWDEASPVKTNNKNVKVTTYTKSDKTLLSLGNFGNEENSALLQINWNALKLNPYQLIARKPAINNFQMEDIIDITKPISTDSKKGWLIILQRKVVTDTVIACDSTIWIDGKLYKENNTTAQYTFTSETTGYDSVVNLYLIINKSTYSIDTRKTCDSLKWIDGKTYYSDNNTAEYRVSENFKGCDSIVKLDLTINNSPTTVINATINGNETYSENGFYETEDSTYYQNIQTYQNCDSIVILNLKVIPTIQMPNAIDPSNNKYNYKTQHYRNQFGPIISGNTSKYEYKMVIFNHWNTIIFETNKLMDEAIDPDKHYWDGKYKGKTLPEDAYLYYIKIRFKKYNNMIEKKGTVSIIYK